MSRNSTNEDKLLIDQIENGMLSHTALKEAAKSVDSKVRIAVAEYKGTAPETLSMLMGDTALKVAIAAMENPACPFEHLSKTRVNVSAVKQADSAPVALWELLAREESSRKKMYLAQLDNCPPSALTIMAGDSNEGVRYYVSTNESADAEALQILAATSNLQTLRNVIFHPNTTPEVSKSFVTHTNYILRGLVARMRTIGIREIDTLIEDESAAVRALLASNTILTTSQLHKLTMDISSEVRLSVAGNPATSPTDLAKLATDEGIGIRIACASNPNTSGETLTYLANDMNRLVLESLVLNNNTPQEAFLVISQRKSGASAVVYRDPDTSQFYPAVPEQWSKKLPYTRLIARRESIANSQFVELARIDDDEIKALICANPLVSVGALAVLSDDASEAISSSAIHKLSDPATLPRIQDHFDEQGMNVDAHDLPVELILALV
jgi:ABC-type transporter Mla MlaB component